MIEPVTQPDIDQRVLELYDEYCHGGIDRREFLRRAGAVVGGLAMAQALLPRYARAQTISFTKTHRLSTGKLGVTGFCWGGRTVNFLAVTLGADLQAGAPFYGAAAETAGVPKIKAPLLLHYAETDPRVNEMRPDFEAALKAAGRPYQAYVYPGTQHGFHNNSTPRYHEASAKLAWERTVAFFRANLA